MARNPRRMALYEVIKSSHSKVPTSQQGQVRNKESKVGDSEGKEPLTHDKGAVSGFDGRLVISVSYRIAAVLLLVLLLVLMTVFRLGQKSGINKASAGQPSGGPAMQNLNDQDFTGGLVPVDSGAKEPQVVDRDQPSVQDKNLDHVVIIATYRTRRDLVPVMEFFGSRGVETGIVERSGYYSLETKQRFASPKERGSKLSKELIRVKEIGQKYEAPSGHESFKPNLFQDAYGMKL